MLTLRPMIRTPYLLALGLGYLSQSDILTFSQHDRESFFSFLLPSTARSPPAPLAQPSAPSFPSLSSGQQQLRGVLLKASPSSSTSSPSPPLVIPSEPPVYGDGTDAMGALLGAFRRAHAKQAEGEGVHVATVVEAGYATVRLYSVIFGSGSLLARVLTRVTGRQVRVLSGICHAPDTPPTALATVRSLLAWEGKARGLEVAARDRSSAIHTTLWIARVLEFMQGYMTIMADESGLSPSVCAQRAYDEKLGPYHGFFIRQLASTALRYVPDQREALYRGFGYITPSGEPCPVLGLSGIPASDREAVLRAVDGAVCADLRECVLLMGPVLDELREALATEGMPGILKSKSEKVIAS